MALWAAKHAAWYIWAVLKQMRPGDASELTLSLPRNTFLPLLPMPCAGGTALSMNWDDVGKRDYSNKGKEGEEDDEEEWARRSRPSGR